MSIAMTRVRYGGGDFFSQTVPRYKAARLIFANARKGKERERCAAKDSDERKKGVGGETRVVVAPLSSAEIRDYTISAYMEGDLRLWRIYVSIPLSCRIVL